MARRDSPYMRTYETGGGFGGADASGTGGFGDLISGLFSKKKGKQAVTAKQPAPEAAPEAAPEVAPEVAPEQTQGPSELREFAKTVDVSDTESVKKLQTMMRDAGHVDSEGNPIKVDGIFGKKTLSAMRSVQDAPILPGKAQTSFDTTIDPSEYTRPEDRPPVNYEGPVKADGSPDVGRLPLYTEKGTTTPPAEATPPAEVVPAGTQPASGMKDTPFARDLTNKGIAEGDVARLQRAGQGVKNWAGDMVEGTQALMANKPIQTAIDYYKPGAKKAGGWLGDMWEGTKGLLGPDAWKTAGKYWGDYISGGPERQAGIEQSARGAGQATGEAVRGGVETLASGAKTAAGVAGEAGQDIYAGGKGFISGVGQGLGGPEEVPPPPPPETEIYGIPPNNYQNRQGPVMPRFHQSQPNYQAGAARRQQEEEPFYQFWTHMFDW